jgi:hypothetical protein
VPAILKNRRGGCSLGPAGAMKLVKGLPRGRPREQSARRSPTEAEGTGRWNEEADEPWRVPRQEGSQGFSFAREVIMRALRKLFGRATPTPRPRFKPRVDELDQRLVPTTFSTYAGAYAPSYSAPAFVAAPVPSSASVPNLAGDTFALGTLTVGWRAPTTPDGRSLTIVSEHDNGQGYATFSGYFYDVNYGFSAAVTGTLSAYAYCSWTGQTDYNISFSGQGWSIYGPSTVYGSGAFWTNRASSNPADYRQVYPNNPTQTQPNAVLNWELDLSIQQVYSPWYYNPLNSSGPVTYSVTSDGASNYWS